MTFYGIVTRLHAKPGIYARRLPGKAERNTGIVAPATSAVPRNYWRLAAALSPLAWGVGTLATHLARKRHPLRLIPGSSGMRKYLHIRGSWLGSDYSLSDDERKILHNLIEDAGQFETMMSAEGESDLVVVARDDLASLGLVHYGGSQATFDPGLYCQHPKHVRTLLPVSRAPELLKEEILEEIVRTFEALAATHIMIEDVTELGSSLSSKKDGVGIDVGAGRTSRVLREKRFEPERIDMERAVANKRYIYDMPSVMTVVEARRDGNQTLDVFEQTVETNCGLNASVLNLFGAKLKGSYKRTWKFRVEFASKTGS